MGYGLFIIPAAEPRVCDLFERAAFGSSYFESVYYAESNILRIMGTGVLKCGVNMECYLVSR